MGMEDGVANHFATNHDEGCILAIDFSVDPKDLVVLLNCM